MARDIAEIRSDIEETRGRLRDTAEAIGWKADVPARARDILRETAGVVRERVAHGHSSPGGSNGHGDSGGPGLFERAKSVVHDVTESVGSAASTVGDKAGSAKDSVSSTASTVGDKVGSAKESVASTASTVGDKVSSATSTVGDKVGTARESMSSGASSATDTAGGAVGTVKEHMPTTGDAREGARQVASVAKANPMALAVGALVLGAAAGIALPRTRVEEEKVGPVAGDLRQRGVEKATEAVQQGREVITEKASEVAERGQEAVAQVSEQASERVHEAADRAGSTDSGPETRGEPVRSVH
jgi:hypothetical protein